MQFLYFTNPTSQIVITGNEYKYLFKVRRIKKNELINIRSLKDDYLYRYKIDEVNKKEAILSLVEKKYFSNKPKNFLHLAWCIIEPKNIEKMLPCLNEIGVSKISFIYCDFSQKNFKLKLERLEKILINSSMQCGRSNIIELEIINSSTEFFKKYPNFTALDFNGEKIECNYKPKNPIFIGPEGGFSKQEKKEFKKIIKLRGFVLRSESAVCAISSKILL